MVREELGELDDHSFRKGRIEMFYSLKSRLIAIFIMLFVISFGALSIVLFNESRSMIRTHIESSALEKMEEYGSYVDMVQMQIYDVASLVFNSEITRNWDRDMSEDGLTDGERMLLNLKFSSFLTQATNSYSSVQRVTVYRNEGTWISGENQVVDDDYFLGESWYQDFRTKGIRWVPGHVDPVEESFGNANSVVSMLMPIGTFEPSHADTVMKINVSTDYFLKPLDRIHLGQSGSIYLLGHDGEPLLSQAGFGNELSRESLIPTIRDDWRKGGILYRSGSGGQKEIIVFKKLNRTGWMLVGIVPEKDLYAELFSLRRNMIIIASILLLLSVALAIWISHGVSKPLSRLVSSMRHVQRGDFSQAELRLPHESGLHSEVGFVTATFRKMVTQLRQHIKNEFELKLFRQQAEYKALLMQINPHFLFNTLELLSSLTMQKRTDDTVQVIESLGKMMRYSLKMNDDLVTFREEWKYAQDYSEILRTRFGDRLHLAMSCGSDLERSPIIKFILQPLIENAVKYSFGHSDTAYVEIRAARSGNSIQLHVDDSGPGIPYSVVKELREKSLSARMEDVLISRSRQIGLGNVLARCGLYYGSLFQFTITTSSRGGASIELILPAQEEA